MTKQVTEITISEGKFKGITYTYGAVSFPDDGEPILKFDYNKVVDINTPYNEEEFRKYIGDKLVEILTEQLKNNEVIYNGGL